MSYYTSTLDEGRVSLEGPESSLLGGKDGDWSGKAEQLLQQQLKSVQEECRQLREAYRHGDGSGRLSRNSRTNSTQSLLQSSSSTKMRASADVSPPSLSVPRHTTHTYTPYSSTTTHHVSPSPSTHVTPSLNAHLSRSTTSLSSLKSAQLETAPPTMMSSRNHQTRTSCTSRYASRQVSSTPRDKQGGVTSREKGSRKKMAAHTSAKRGGSEGWSRSKEAVSSSVATTTAQAPSKTQPTSSRCGEWQQPEHGKVGSGRFTSSTHVQDSGYSSGSGPKPRVSLRATDQPPAGSGGIAGVNSGNGLDAVAQMSSVAVFSGSPSLPHPSPAASVSIPATISSIHLAGRGGGKGVNSSRREEDVRWVERGRVRQLEHEVAVLEQQLSEKTRAARSHVEELTCLRSELARERAALARERQESREAAGAQLKREKTAHEEQCWELMGQLERLRVEKKEGDRAIGTLRASLKASEAEVVRVSEAVTRMTQQLEGERESHTTTTRSLHTVAEEGRTKVAELEQSLRACHDEVSGHINSLGEMERAHQTQIDTLRSKISSLDATLSATTTQLQDKTAAVSELRAELARAQAQHELQLQDRTDIVSQLQDDLTRLRTQKEREREGERRKEEDLKRSLAQSEQVRQSLLVQVEKNGQELERLTERLAVVQGREGEAERCRAEAEQLKKIVSELQRGRQEQETESKQSQEERRRLQVELGHLQAQLETANSHLQQARDRETEYSRATAELIKEAGQVRAESGRVKVQLETSQRDLEEVKRQLREKEESVESSVGSMRGELATRAQQVLEIEELLRTQQTESTSRRLELERNLAQCQSDLRTRTQQLDQLTVQLGQSQKTTGQLQAKVTQFQSAEQNRCSDAEKQLSSKDTELAVLHNRLQSLQESHSAVLASSEQLASTHRRAETQVAEQLRMRQEELSRTRAQVSSLSIELTGEKKIAEELRSQLTLARAEAARHQAQVSSMQRAVSLGNMATLGIAGGLHTSHHSLPPSSTSHHSLPLSSTSHHSLPLSSTSHHSHSFPPSSNSTGSKADSTTTNHSRASSTTSKLAPTTNSTSQRRGQVIDL